MIPFKPGKEEAGAALLVVLLLLLLLSRKGFGFNLFGSGFGNTVKGIEDFKKLLLKAQNKDQDFAGVKVEGLRLVLTPADLVYRSVTEINTINGQKTVNNSPAVNYTVTSREVIPLEAVSVDSSGNVIATSKKSSALLVTPSGATGNTVIYYDFLLDPIQAQTLIKGI